jgi:drug/metabolite transporter (DMT)-like permease
MLAAVLTAFLFATSTICGHRSSRQIGGVEANFWRITLATIFLTLWTCAFGTGFAGAPWWFVLSGLCGIGWGDSAYFQALPRLGSRRTVLLVQCLTAPCAALIEWVWLGTKLHLPEIFCIAVILSGVAIALAPGDHRHLKPRDWKIGIVASVLAAIGGALGAVLIRKAYAVAHAQGIFPDAGTTGYQRVLGGILVPTIILLVVKWRSAQSHGRVWEKKTWRVSLEKWRRIWPWVLANSLAGQTLGVTCMQWALKTTPTGIVTAIIATTPALLLPMTRIVDGERIGIRSLVGSCVAVGGVLGLIALRK